MLDTDHTSEQPEVINRTAQPFDNAGIRAYHYEYDKGVFA